VLLIYFVVSYREDLYYKCAVGDWFLGEMIGLHVLEIGSLVVYAIALVYQSPGDFKVLVCLALMVPYLFNSLQQIGLNKLILTFTSVITTTQFVGFGSSIDSNSVQWMVDVSRSNSVGRRRSSQNHFSSTVFVHSELGSSK
jgi:hypothetical protein